jgi:hypothetical protein
MTINFNGEDVVQIIRACSKAKVTRLKMGELEVVFDKVEDGVTIRHEPIVESVTQTLHSNLSSEEPTDKKFIEEFDQELEEANLLLENPTEWERRALLSDNQEVV